jgi:hypothetical protein
MTTNNTPQERDPLRIGTLAMETLTRRPSHETPQRTTDALHAEAALLFQRFDPSSQRMLDRVRDFPIPTYFPQSVLRSSDAGNEMPIDWALASAVTGARLFLQGESLGVGASTLGATFARSVNLTAGAAGYAHRVLYAPMTRGCSSITKVFDALLLMLRSPLSTTELRSRSPLYHAIRVSHAAQRQHVCAIIVDHVHLLAPEVRQCLATLADALDPARHVPLDIPPDAEVHQRVGLVMIDHTPPELLFRESPEVLLALEGKVVTLRRYRTVEQLGDALRLVDLRLEDLDLMNAADRALTETLLEYSHGLPALLTPLLRLIGATMCARARPTPQTIASALPLFRQLLETQHRVNRYTGEDALQVSAKRPREAQHATAADATDDRQITNADRHRRRAIKEARHLAKAEQRDMQRRSTTTVDMGEVTT